MCLDCGCLRPTDDHSDPRHITAARLSQASQANGNKPIETARQIVTTLSQKPSDAAKAFAQTADRPTVGFDIDDTIAQRVQALLGVLNVADGGNRTMAQVTTPRHEDLWPLQRDLIKKAHETPGFYRNQGVYDATRELAWVLKRAGFHIIIASKRDKEIKQVSLDWLKENDFPEFDSYEFGNNSKYKASGKFGKERLVFIDDDPRNLFAFDQPTTKFYMLKRPWNAQLQGRAGYNVIDDLGVIYDTLGLEKSTAALTQVSL